MASYMKVILVGNLTRDPELKTVGETCVCDFAIAIDDGYKKKSGEKVERTEFIDIVVWGVQGENANKYLSKGSSVLVEGKWQTDRWENEAGEKRSKVRVRADRVQFLSTKSQSTGTRPASVTDTAAASAPAIDDDDDVPF